MRQQRAVAAVGLCALAVASFARAQITFVPGNLHTGDSADDSFGYSVRSAGDINGDGFADYIVGMPYDDDNGGTCGGARVFSGVDGITLHTRYGDSVGDQLGWSVSGAGDVNNDGLDDYIVGAPFDDNTGAQSGSARVRSGANAAILYTLNGDSSGDQLGRSVSGIGDVNNDGFDDFIAGAYLDDNNGVDSGSVRVYSGINGAALYTINGDSAGDWFGWSVSGAGDVNGDGVPDFIAGARFDDNNGLDSGSARVCSGIGGATLYTFNGVSGSNQFGGSVSGAGDVNGDGFADVIVGSYIAANSFGSQAGMARVFSGVNGAILYTLYGDSGGDWFAWSVSGAGDVDGDGFDDFIVGAPRDDNNGADSGSARIFSGADGSILYTFNGDSAGDELGWSVSGAGDVNGDGLDDVIVGAHLNDRAGADSGSARVFLSAPPPPACPGNANADSVVNFDDITAVIANWLNTCP